MRIREKCSALSQPIDVRRLDLRMTAQATDPVVQIIDGDEEDVGRTSRDRRGGDGEQSREH